MSININMKGRFTFKPPFVTHPELIYNVTAIREMSDFSSYGIDVYKHVYMKVGLINGSEHDGKTFNFADEARNNPAIITLEANDGSIVYIPENYILSYPNMSDVVYSRIILAADLGGLPDYVFLGDIKDELTELLNAKLGLKTEFKIVKGPFMAQPTAEEHETLEASRIGSVKVVSNTFSELARCKQQLQEQDKTIKAMTALLRERGIL